MHTPLATVRTTACLDEDYPMADDYREPLDTELIKQLRSIAATAESPSDILFYLAAKIQDEDAFVDYLLTAFGDQSIMWEIATRWWRGE